MLRPLKAWLIAMQVRQPDQQEPGGT